MGRFRHPHLVRGIVHTSEGAFQIERGIADLPDEVGAALGWIRVSDHPCGPADRAAGFQRRSGCRSRRRALAEVSASPRGCRRPHVTGILNVLRTYSMLAWVSATKSPVGAPVSSTYQPR